MPFHTRPAWAACLIAAGEGRTRGRCCWQGRFSAIWTRPAAPDRMLWAALAAAAAVDGLMRALPVQDGPGPWFDAPLAGSSGGAQAGSGLNGMSRGVLAESKCRMRSSASDAVN